MSDLLSEISACGLCAPRFAATATGHHPRPVVQIAPSARLLICGQAPGARVHESGRPFTDASGDRLRDWLGLEHDLFYDAAQVAIVPMGFCFPGYNSAGHDLPPPRICAQTWRARVLAALPEIRLTLLVGGYAQKWHLGSKTRMTDAVAGWRDLPNGTLCLPHPSWRNTGWLRRNPWFEADVLPVLRRKVTEALDDN